MPSISACIIVYNEEKIIGRCLESIKDLVDEIIIIHDGECTDNTLEIAKKYTGKIFIKEHIGIAEPLRSFSYQVASGEWILQIDADEYFDREDIGKIKNLLLDNSVNGYQFKWELRSGDRPIYIKGLQKLCVFRKNAISYQGIPQTAVIVRGKTKKVDIFLRHRPLYDNVSWATANKKRKYWLQSHVKYFFPELVKYECFNTTPDSWIEYTKKVRRHQVFYLFFYPLKNMAGQLKNGLWRTWIGWNIALQQYVYYIALYYRVWRKKIT
jgi:glycosyltransferase involved in cell wall biosynthesis